VTVTVTIHSPAAGSVSVLEPLEVCAPAPHDAVQFPEQPAGAVADHAKPVPVPFEQLTVNGRPVPAVAGPGAAGLKLHANAGAALQVTVAEPLPFLVPSEAATV
jgi:hypothetical protein